MPTLKDEFNRIPKVGDEIIKQSRSKSKHLSRAYVAEISKHFGQPALITVSSKKQLAEYLKQKKEGINKPKVWTESTMSGFIIVDSIDGKLEWVFKK